MSPRLDGRACAKTTRIFSLSFFMSLTKETSCPIRVRPTLAREWRPEWSNEDTISLKPVQVFSKSPTIFQKVRWFSKQSEKFAFGTSSSFAMLLCRVYKTTMQYESHTIVYAETLLPQRRKRWSLNYKAEADIYFSRTIKILVWKGWTSSDNMEALLGLSWRKPEIGIDG